MSRAGRVLRAAFVVSIVALCAYAGLEDGLRAFAGAVTAAQRVASVTQLLYGALSVAVLLAMLFRRGWVAALLLAWGAAVTVTGGLAPVVWGEQGWGVGAAAGASVAAAVALVLWAWRAHERAGTPGGAEPAGR